ncbi:MAG: glycosyltransferase family 4 protein, partial [Clostridia bacterium]|nr:glycosyltransferase family 4 protein [Clostridia bacterium]
MNILFVSISGLPNMESHSISLDLIHELTALGHKVYAVCANERRNKKPTTLSEEAGCKVLRVKVGNNKNTNIIEKGISNLMLPYQYIAAIKKYFSDVKFDLVLYPTPPVTQVKTVDFIKKRDNAKNYLLLKDIFPQNAVDIGMMTKTGPKSVIYKMFRKKEEKLYAVSDFIGCMSEANREYLIKHNPGLDESKIHINPNSIEVQEVVKDEEKIKEIKAKYNIPENAVTFIYGGNLGRPQGIPFIIKCLKANAGKEDRFFVICGKGTEYPKLKAYVEAEKPSNVLLLNGLPKEEYEVFVKAFDIGLIFLDHRFTIPNFPSRLLSYMQSSMPVLSCTDPNTDVGKVIEEGGFGWSCESNSVEAFTDAVDKAIGANLAEMGAKGL